MRRSARCTEIDRLFDSPAKPEWAARFLGLPRGDGAALVLGDAGVGARRVQDDVHFGLVRKADRVPVHPAVFDLVANLEAEGVATEGQGGLRVIVREEG